MTGVWSGASALGSQAANLVHYAYVCVWGEGDAGGQAASPGQS